MLNRLIQFALAQRLFVLLAAALLAAAGWFAFQRLPIDAFPDVSSTQVKVIMKAPGMTPEEIETRIAIPIEVLGEMFMFTVEADNMSIAERRSLLDWVIRPALRAVPGVADVNALGGVVRSFEVVPDPVKLAAVGLSINDLQTAIGANNRNDGAGRLSEGDEVLLVRTEGNIRNLDDLRAIVVTRKNGVPVRMGDVAEVRIGALTRYGVVTKDGRGEAVEGLVLGLAGANARDVVSGVEKKLAELAPSLPAGVKLQVFYNRADLVNKAVGTVSKALIEGTLLVLILLGAFLGNVRAAITVAVVLPLAALATFILMRAGGMSANLMSLGGLAIAIGMLVDAAVVVVENIVQHLGHDKAGGKLPRLHIIFRAVREVAVPVTAGILIIITVFLPLLTLQDLEGKMFVPLAGAVADGDSGAGVVPAQEGSARRPVVAAQIAGRVSPDTGVGHATSARGVYRSGRDVGDHYRRLHDGGQDLHADHGRGRPHRGYRETA